MRTSMVLGIASGAIVLACAVERGDDAASSEAAETTAALDTESLLDELFDRASVASTSRFDTRMHSSRAPLGPDGPIVPASADERAAWFPRCGIELPNPCTRDVNMDFVEARDDETMLDRFDAPLGGALVRFWTVGDPGTARERTIRFYVDDDPVPLTLVLPAASNAALPFPFGDPDAPAARSVLGSVTENGITIHTPIVFARSLRITSAGRPSNGRLYYQATYRAARERIGVTPTPTHGPRLDALAARARSLAARFWSTPAYGAAGPAPWTALGGGTVRAVRIDVPADARASDIRGARLVVRANGRVTVDVPLLDFFATTLAPERTRAVVDHASGFVSAANLAPVPGRGIPFALESRWPIPFDGDVRIDVVGVPGVLVRAELDRSPPSSPFTLHASAASADARAAEPVVVRMLDVAGEGSYAGTTLAVDNGTDPTWWGEGDELVRADDAVVMAGTGMEDFFGYGYSSSMPFAGALHAQTVASGRRPGIAPASWAGVDTYDNSGVAIDTRAMVTDRVRFERRLTFDWELLHTHYLRPFMESAPPPRVRFDSLFSIRVVHHWYAR